MGPTSMQIAILLLLFLTGIVYAPAQNSAEFKLDYQISKTADGQFKLQGVLNHTSEFRGTAVVTVTTEDGRNLKFNVEVTGPTAEFDLNLSSRPLSVTASRATASPDNRALVAPESSEESDTATLKETIESLKPKIKQARTVNVSPGGMFETRILIEDVQIDGCNVRLIQKWTSLEHRHEPVLTYSDVVRNVSFSLADIDPISVVNGSGIYDDHHTVSFAAASGRSVINIVTNSTARNRVDDRKDKKAPFDEIYHIRNVGGDLVPKKYRIVRTSKTETVAGWYFGYQNRETAKRTAAALKHAVKLCGGKVDPF